MAPSLEVSETHVNSQFCQRENKGPLGTRSGGLSQLFQVQHVVKKQK